MSQTYNCRPSEFFQPIDPVVAFYLDRMLWRFGTAIDGEIELAAEDAKNSREALMKQQNVINRWLGSAGGARYRDPAARR